MNVYGSATQATASHTILAINSLYNTNSAYNVKGLELNNNENS